MWVTGVQVIRALACLTSGKKTESERPRPISSRKIHFALVLQHCCNPVTLQ